MVDLICELGPGEIEADYRGAGNPSGEIERQYLDSAKIRAEIGWEPSVELREGLGRTLGWYREHPEIRPVAST